MPAHIHPSSHRCTFRLKHFNHEERRQVCFAIALWNIEQNPQNVLTVLLDAVESADNRVRAFVARVLCELAPEYRVAADAFLKLSDDPSFAVRWHAKGYTGDRCGS